MWDTNSLPVESHLEEPCFKMCLGLVGGFGVNPLMKIFRLTNLSSIFFTENEIERKKKGTTFYPKKREVR